MNAISVQRLGSLDKVTEAIEAADTLGLAFEVRSVSTQILGVKTRAWELKIGVEEDVE